MSEENKFYELKDKDLENVNGGRIKIKNGTVTDGDCNNKITVSGGFCLNSIFCTLSDCKYHE